MRKEDATAVMVIPGLRDWVKETEFFTRHWPHYGLIPFVESARWNDNLEGFESKYKRLEKRFLQLVEIYKSVEVVGCSAGGPMAGVLFARHSDEITLFTNNCGRLEVGPMTGLRSFPAKTKTSSAFAEAVRKFETLEPMLTSEQCRKIINVQALADELVPRVEIPGAKNVISLPEHGVGISWALLRYPWLRQRQTDRINTL